MTLPRHPKAPLLCLLIANGVTSFQSAPHHGRRSRHVTPHLISSSSRSTIISTLSLANNDKLLEELDAELAREVEEALQLANEAWTTDDEYEIDEEAEIAEIAAALTSAPRDRWDLLSGPSPPKKNPPLFFLRNDSANQEEEEEEEAPYPPKPVITASPPKKNPSWFFLLNDAANREDDEEEEKQPLPPLDPPSPNAVSFGETLSKAVSDEIDRLKTLLFGLQQDLQVTESNAVRAESVAEAIKRDIEESRMQREAVMKEIESQFRAERESLMEQLGSASRELAGVIEDSVKNITNAQSVASKAEKELLDRMDEFADSIKRVIEETVGLNMEKEQLLKSKQVKIDEAKKEASEKLLKYKAELSKDGETIKLYNAKLQKKADDAERKVRDIYASVKQVREDRISLQQQIEDVERESLEQIATLEQEILEDDKEYTSYLEGERARINKVISDAKDKYASVLEKEKAKRRSIEEDFEAQLAQKDAEGKAAFAAIESKAKSRLNELEEEHSAERIAIYQEKIEAVSLIRNETLAQLKIEDDKLNLIHEEMQIQIDNVRAEIAEVNAAFEQELAERRQVAEVEKTMFLNRMEDVRSDMEGKINAQRKEIEDEKSEFLREHNLLVDESEEECRRAWVELATLKMKVGYAGDKRNDMITEVKRKSDLIASYEREKSSFRKSLRQSFKVAREKIGSGTRRVLRRGKERTDV